MILFGLSMDYHVYILSRVREGFLKGMSTDDAVAHGIKQTAGVVTSAAFVMLGDRNWYLPSWLEWIPTLDHEGSVDQPQPKSSPEHGLGPIPEPAGA